MGSVKDYLESKDITISLCYYTLQDFGTGWEIKSIVENPDVFDELYSHYSLKELSDFDEYYLYLLSLKFICLREVVPALLQESHKSILSKLSDNAEKAIAGLNTGDVVRFINNFIKELFDDEITSTDVRIVTLDLIAKYCDGISRDAFEFLCKNHGYLLIDSFDKFEKVFEQYPDLFELIYKTGGLDEIKSIRLDNTLEVWCHILNKKKSNLKDIVLSRVNVLATDVKSLNETATIGNITHVEGTIREFYWFLQRAHNPMANEFKSYAKSASELMSKRMKDNGQFFQYEIPVKEMVEKWKAIEDGKKRLLSLTHRIMIENGTMDCFSLLSEDIDVKNSLLDLIRTNIPTDDFFTVSYQQSLSVRASVGTGVLFGIIREQEVLLEYLSLVTSAFSLIVEKLDVQEEDLIKDVEMLSALVQLVGNNIEKNTDAIHGICYGASMYMCALSEKLLRLLYVYLAKDELYIPVNKATIGDLLSVNNNYVVNVFGENHIKNLSFFLQRTSSSNVGQNLRNNLAHWSDVSKEAMTPFLVAKTLWLFTDILNTVFWYCLKDTIELNNNDLQ